MDKKELPFKDAFTFEEREKMSSDFTKEHPNYIPIVCEKHRRSKLNHPPKVKFLISNELKLFHLIRKIRNSIRLDESNALYLFVQGNSLLKPNSKMIEVYEQYKDADGFLYVEYYEHSSFG